MKPQRQKQRCPALQKYDVVLKMTITVVTSMDRNFGVGTNLASNFVS